MWRCSKLFLAIALTFVGAFASVCAFPQIAGAAPASTKPSAALPLRGRLLVNASGEYWVSWQNQELKLWQRSRQQVLKTLNFEAPLYQVELSHNGQFLVAGLSDGSYHRWHFPAMTPAGTLRLTKTEQVQWPFAVSPDGVYLTRTLFQQRQKQDIMRLEVWDWRTQRRVNRLWAHQQALVLPGHYPGSQLAFHPLGGYLAFATEGGQLKIYDTQQHRWRYQMPGSPPLSYDQAGDYFAFALPGAQNDRISHVKLWHLPTNLLKTFAVKEMSATDSALTLSEDGKYLAYTARAEGAYRRLIVQRVRDARVVLTVRVPEEVDALTLLPGEQTVLTSSLLRPDFQPERYAF